MKSGLKSLVLISKLFAQLKKAQKVLGRNLVDRGQGGRVGAAPWEHARDEPHGRAARGAALAACGAAKRARGWRTPASWQPASSPPAAIAHALLALALTFASSRAAAASMLDHFTIFTRSASRVLAALAVALPH